MKRIMAACICQTLHFLCKEGSEQQWAAEQVKRDVENYKKSLDRNRTQYKIIEETVQSDGSVILKIIKQYNTSPVGNYLD
jgi:expansin (peptidoglycan-binding protein)